MVTSETYFDAAVEHADLAQKLYNTGWHGAAHYWAGLAVECMLRAYRVRTDPEFDARHDLRELLRQSGFYERVPRDRHKTLSLHFSEVIQRWSNEHRFRSKKAILKWLKTQKSNWRIKGDLLKESARRTSNAALAIVGEGELRWKGA